MGRISNARLSTFKLKDTPTPQVESEDLMDLTFNEQNV